MPWQPVGPASTAVRATIPACGTYFGWTDLTTQTSSALEVLARAPFDPRCTPEADSPLVVDSVVPLGRGPGARFPTPRWGRSTACAPSPEADPDSPAPAAGRVADRGLRPKWRDGEAR